LRFQPGANEDARVSITQASLRDVANADLPVSTENLFLDLEGSTPSVTRLLGAWPNPFRPSTVVTYEVRQPAHVTLRVYDPRGRLVADLVDQDVGPGRHRVSWNGSNDAGCEVTSGVYLIRMRAGTYESTTKVVVLR
jgi:hypothetical protein